MTSMKTAVFYSLLGLCVSGGFGAGFAVKSSDIDEAFRLAQECMMEQPRGNVMEKGSITRSQAKGY